MSPPPPKHLPTEPTTTHRCRLLIAVAAPAEADAVREAARQLTIPQTEAHPLQQGDLWAIEPLGAVQGVGVDLIETGVGKAQAAGAVARVFDADRHLGVLSIGVGGALPSAGPSADPTGAAAGVPLAIGTAVLATRSLFADEGVRTPDAFLPIDEVGFPPARFETGGMPCDPAWFGVLRPLCDMEGVSATVSACSGSDRGAADIAARTHAVVENMEGAAVAAALSRLTDRPRFAELRVISNTTGDRDRQTWDLPRALDRLTALARDAISLICSAQSG